MTILTFDTRRNRFEFICSFDYRHIPKNAHFRWDSDTKRWYSENLAPVIALKEYADVKAKAVLNRSLITVEKETKPRLHMKELIYGFQMDAARFALSRNRSYLAMDPGLGKTATAVTCVSSQPGPVLYITPPFLKFNIENEFKKWSTSQLKIVIISPRGLDIQDADVVIVPDSVIHKPMVLAALQTRQYKWMFIDEAHRFKTQEALRTLALFGGRGKAKKTVYRGLVDCAEKVVCLSGTPMPNRPIELFPLLSKLAPETIGFNDFFGYAMKYCAAHENQFGWDFDGASNVDELARNVKEKFMLRIKKQDVLKELPPKTNQIIFLEDKVPSALKKLEFSLTIQKTIEELIDTHGVTDSSPTYRKELGLAKIQEAVAFIKSEMEDNPDEAFLVFAWHKSVIWTLRDALIDFHPGVITGETLMEERQKCVNEFQLLKSSRLLIGNIQAMGMGYTLTKATRVIFVETSWVPAENEQASDRAHRIGQKSNVLVQYLALLGTLDVRIIESLLRKQKTIERIMG